MGNSVGNTPFPDSNRNKRTSKSQLDDWTYNRMNERERTEYERKVAAAQRTFEEAHVYTIQDHSINFIFHIYSTILIGHYY